MINFKEIAEKCLAGELSGIFVLRNGDKCISSNFKKDQSLLTSFIYLEHFHYSDNGRCYISTGYKSKFDIIDFIPDNMQEQIKIDVPEGKVPVMEQTESGVVITWEEKELTYVDVIKEIANRPKHIIGFSYNAINDTTSSSPFYRKVEVLRKLTNIRNYFGKSTNDKGYGIFYHEYYKRFYVDIVHPSNNVHVCFSTKEHAEQAIKMLGEELKYLFEPW